MTSPTHIAFAEFLYLMILTTAGIALSPLNALVVAASSVLPDLDNVSTRIGRTLPFIARPLESRFGHRTITHSLVAICTLAGIAILLSHIGSHAKDLSLCFLAGYSSHPFLDTMTINGVQLFFPFSSVKCVFPLEVNNPHRYRVETGSKMDHTLGVIFLTACLPAFLIANEGYERFVRTTQKNIESAVRDYNDFSKHSTVYASIKGYDMLTKEHIHGDFEVIGTLNEATLVFEGPDGRIHTLGREYHATYAADEVLCRPGENVRTEVRSVDMSNQPLSQLRSYIDSSARNHFFGLLWTTDPVSIPQDIREFSPVTAASGAMKLSHARISDLDFLGDLFITRGVLTVRTLFPITSGEQQEPFQDQKTPSYTQITFQVDEGKTVILARHIGDSVGAGTILANIASNEFLVDRRELIAAKLTTLDRERDSKQTATLAQMERVAQEIRKDSISLSQARRLREEGFSAGKGESNLRVKIAVSRQKLESLRFSLQTAMDRRHLESLKLEADLRELERKQESTTRKSLIQSQVTGVITDIRQSRHKTRLQYTFTIRLTHEHAR